jgi:hypothetical protein
LRDQKRLECVFARAYAEAQQLPSSDEVTGEIWKKLGRPVAPKGMEPKLAESLI